MDVLPGRSPCRSAPRLVDLTDRIAVMPSPLTSFDIGGREIKALRHDL